jgi:hypothetical protein
VLTGCPPCKQGPIGRFPGTWRFGNAAAVTALVCVLAAAVGGANGLRLVSGPHTPAAAVARAVGDSSVTAAAALGVSHTATAAAGLTASTGQQAITSAQSVIDGPTCPDVMVIAARGMGEPPKGSAGTNPSNYTNGNGAGGTLTSLYSALVNSRKDLTFSLEPVVYPVPDLSWKDLLTLTQFEPDAQKGAANIVDDILQTDTACSHTVRYVLTGYSLGAWAVHEALNELSQLKPSPLGEVAGVALFGDPKFLPNQPIDKDFVDLDTNYGMATGVDKTDNNVPAAVVAYTGSWCFPDDPVCQVLKDRAAWLWELKTCASGSASCGHFQYVNQETQEAAAFLDPLLWHLKLTTPPEGTVGDPYSWTATAASQGSLTWTSDGTLPPGLAFSVAGVLSGTLAQAGTFTFEVKATDTYGRYASGQVPVTVNPASGNGSATGTWTTAEAPLPANAASDASVLSLGPAACPSISVCVVAGRTTDHPELLTGSGTSWTATEAPVPAGAGNPWIHALACASASACVATGSYADSSGNTHGMLITGSGTSWTAITAPLPPDAGAGQAANLWFVACASTCVATGNYVDSSGYFQGLILTGFGASWTATKAPQPANASSLSEVSVGSVACPSATTCVTIGGYTDSAGNQQAMLITGSGTSWTATEAPLPPNVTAWYTQGVGGGLAGLACASASACVASGDYVDSSGYFQGVILTGSGTSWTTTITLLPANASTTQNIFNLDSVACASASKCVATGSYRDSSGNSQVLLLAGSGTSWTATEAPLPADAASNPRADGSAVACPSTTMCIATASYRDSSDNTQGLLLAGLGTSWTATEAPLPANAATGATTYAELNSVACYSASTCVATGEYVDSAYNQQGLILTGNLSG